MSGSEYIDEFSGDPGREKQPWFLVRWLRSFWRRAPRGDGAVAPSEPPEVAPSLETAAETGSRPQSPEAQTAETGTSQQAGPAPPPGVPEPPASPQLLLPSSDPLLIELETAPAPAQSAPPPTPPGDPVLTELETIRRQVKEITEVLTGMARSFDSLPSRLRVQIEQIVDAERNAVNQARAERFERQYEALRKSEPLYQVARLVWNVVEKLEQQGETRFLTALSMYGDTARLAAQLDGLHGFPDRSEEALEEMRDLERRLGYLRQKHVRGYLLDLIDQAWRRQIEIDDLLLSLDLELLIPNQVEPLTDMSSVTVRETKGSGNLRYVREIVSPGYRDVRTGVVERKPTVELELRSGATAFSGGD